MHLVIVNLLRNIADMVLIPLTYALAVWAITLLFAPNVNQAINTIVMDFVGLVIDTITTIIADSIKKEVGV